MLKQIQKYLKNIDLEIISNLSLIIKLLIILFSILVLLIIRQLFATFLWLIMLNKGYSKISFVDVKIR